MSKHRMAKGRSLSSAEGEKEEMKRKLSKEEKAEVEARKRHRPINDAIRAGRGTTVSVGSGTPKSNVAMGQFVRQSAGRTNGKAGKRELMKLKRIAAEHGFILSDDGETILHDIREEE